MVDKGIYGGRNNPGAFFSMTTSENDTKQGSYARQSDYGATKRAYVLMVVTGTYGAFPVLGSTRMEIDPPGVRLETCVTLVPLL